MVPRKRKGILKNIETHLIFIVQKLYFLRTLADYYACVRGIWNPVRDPKCPFLGLSQLTIL